MVSQREHRGASSVLALIMAVVLWGCSSDSDGQDQGTDVGNDTPPGGTDMTGDPDQAAAPSVAGTWLEPEEGMCLVLAQEQASASGRMCAAGDDDLFTCTPATGAVSSAGLTLTFTFFDALYEVTAALSQDGNTLSGYALVEEKGCDGPADCPLTFVRRSELNCSQGQPLPSE
jgi:hypothetical protein